MQLELFPETENDKLKREIAAVRRGTFSRINELTKLCLRLQLEIDELKKSQGFFDPPKVVNE